MGKYRTFGNLFGRVFRNDLNKNFDDIDADIKEQKSRVDDLIRENPQPSEVVDARLGYPLLRDKLQATDSQLAQIAIQVSSNGNDDSQTLQNAIDEVFAKGGGKVLLADQTFKITSSIVLKTKVLLCSNKMAIIEYTGNGSAIILSGQGGHFENGGLENVTIKKSTRDYLGKGVFADVTTNGDTRRIAKTSVFDNVIVNDFEYGFHLRYNGVVGATATNWYKIFCHRNRIGFFLEGVTITSQRPWFNLNKFENCEFNYNVNGGFVIQNFGSVQALTFKTCDFSVNGENAYQSALNEAYGFRCDDKAEVFFDSCYFEFAYLFRKPTAQEHTNFTQNGTLTSKGTYKIGNEEYHTGWGIFPIEIPESNDTAAISVRWANLVTLKNCMLANNSRFILCKFAGNINVESCNWVNNSLTEAVTAKALVQFLYAQTDPAFASSVQIDQLKTVVNLPRVYTNENIPIGGNVFNSNSYVENINRPQIAEIWLDALNGDNRNPGTQTHPVQTLAKAFAIASGINNRVVRIVLKQGSEAIIEWGNTINNTHVIIASENASNKSKLIFRKIPIQNALATYRFVNSYVELSNIVVQLDWVDAGSGVNATYAFDMPTSTLRLVNTDVTSNNQHLAIHGVAISKSNIELSNVNLSGAVSRVSKLIGSGKIETASWGGNVATSGWTIIGQL